MSDKATPYVLSFVICDQIYTDQSTGKISLMGMFSGVGGMSFPLIHKALCASIEMTDGRGETPLSFRLVDADEEKEPLILDERMVDFTDPLAVVHAKFAMANLTFPAPGEYRFQVLAHGELLMERRLVVMLMKGSEQ